ncbi:MAG: PrsW family intramembrane metalloprotease [Clostridia bacterium]|nr:PrsW family intramembrane metalloprotease [Clostridia bacterium]
MSLNEKLLTVAAILPALILCIYVYKKDRVEKEPAGLLITLLISGMAIVYPAAEIETFVIGVLERVFAGFNMNSPIVNRAFIAAEMFLIVAVTEEGLKYICLNFFTKNNKEFNCIFDGLIYAVFVSLGFALLENVMYVLSYGWTNALLRGIMSVPGHMFFAVMMGYYYSLGKIADKAQELESYYQIKGLIDSTQPGFNSKSLRIKSFVIPVVLHGTYNYCCSVGTKVATAFLVMLLFFMYSHCFRKIRLLSKNDGNNISYARALLLKKYPDLKEEE